jgi:hypothetical protein
MRRKSRIAWIVQIALLLAMCAVATSAWLRARDAAVRADALAREVAALGERLGAESIARAALEAETRSLRATPATEPPANVAGATADPAGAVATAPPEDAVESPGEPATGEAKLAPVDVERVIAAGFRREDVERFRTRSDQIDLKRVYLRDRATREGWIGTPQFQQELQAINAEQAGLRSEFDEPLYDWMLFAAGQPNRVGVAGVLAGSAAESVGLAPGDVIVRYDEQLMLSVQDLLGATNAGRAGELVEVEVLRTGQRDPVRLFLPRGPIGVRIAPVIVEPRTSG